MFKYASDRRSFEKMSETNYYIRNWGRILIFLAICCAAEIIFSAFAVLAKVVIIGILLSNNKKFLYLVKTRGDRFKKYYHFLKGACILFGISIIILIIEYITMQAIFMFYLDGFDPYLYLIWMEMYGGIFSLCFGIGVYLLILAGFILEIIAWSYLKKSFEDNLLGAQGYHRENLQRGAKILIWGALIVAIFYFVDIGYLIFDYVFGVPYDPYSGYYYSLYSLLGISFLEMIFFLVKGVGLVLLCVGHATIGSNLKNPYFGLSSRSFQSSTNQIAQSPLKVLKNPNNINFCQHCGSKIHPEGKFCPTCGKPISR